MICSHLAGGVVGMLGQFGVHAVQAHHVSDITNCEASFIQDGNDAFVRLLHKVHNDLVVEVINLGIDNKTIWLLGKCSDQGWLMSILKVEFFWGGATCSN